MLQTTMWFCFVPEEKKNPICLDASMVIASWDGSKSIDWFYYTGFILTRIQYLLIEKTIQI